jgi:hypothetical protein
MSCFPQPPKNKEFLFIVNEPEVDRRIPKPSRKKAPSRWFRAHHVRRIRLEPGPRTPVIEPADERCLAIAAIDPTYILYATMPLFSRTHDVDQQN